MSTVLWSSPQQRFEVSAEGIEVWWRLSRWFGRERYRYLLDVNVDHYWAWEDDEPSGICVSPVRLHTDEKESRCFGPTQGADIDALIRDARTVIEAARSQLPPTPQALRAPLLVPHEKRLDLPHATRDGQGRLRTIAVVERFVLGGLALPAGSILQLNGEVYLDPRRDDRLTGAVIASRVPLPTGIEATPQARVSFSHDGRVIGVRGELGPLDLDSFPVDASKGVRWDRNGVLAGFELAAEIQLGGYQVPAGSHFSRQPAFARLPERWSCILAGSLELRELTLREKDLVTFDCATRRLLDFHLPGKRPFGDEVLVSGPIHLLPNGLIDRARARKFGSLRAREET